jgi:hypothetical protein
MVMTTLFEDVGDASLVVLNLCRLLMSAGCPSSKVYVYLSAFVQFHVFFLCSLYLSVVISAAQA